MRLWIVLGRLRKELKLFG
jgi:hypothetical protein